MSHKITKRIDKVKGLLKFISSVVLLRYTRFNTKFLKHHHRKLAVDRLHVGCGDILLAGWLNIRFDRREEYGRTRIEKGALLLNYNLLKPWPFADEVIQYIAGSHFIEHLDLNQGMAFVQECYRVLRKGGRLRLSCPDLEIYTRNYVKRNEDFFNHELIREWCCFKKAVTPGEIFIAKAYDSGGSHKWFYDLESLKHVLATAGFKQIRRVNRLEGKVPDLEKIEPPRRELETLYVEALKE